MRVGRVIVDVGATTGKIVDALANGLTFNENFRAKVIGPLTTPSGTDVEFTVAHNLGVIPAGYIWTVDQGVVIYDSRRDQWTTSQMFLKCTGSIVKVRLIVF